MLQSLCMPALIYLIYSLTHVIIDMYKAEYSKAMIEFWLSAIFTLLLNILCQQGLGIVSWLIVSIPFILMTTIASILLFAFQVNPATGKPLQPTQENQENQQPQPSPYAYPIVAQYKDTHPSGYDKKDKYTQVASIQPTP
jgi:hypothetical protein